MAWARVAVTDENFHPLIGIDIECFDVDTMVPISVVATDLGGIALFTALPGNQRYFFKARILRTSTRVQSILYPDQGRTYTGMVRLQILNQHPGMTCFDALVDPTGHVGSHTTIQAAIDAYNLPSTYRPWNIGVLPKATAYSENLVFTSTRRYVLQPACAPSNVMDWSGGGEGSVDAGGLACPIVIQGPSAASATIGTTGAGTGQLELRGVWVKNSGYTNSLNVSYLNLRLIDCQISGGTGTSAGLYLGTVCSVEAHRCIIGDSTTGKAVNMTLATYLRAVDTVFIGWVDLSSQLGAVLQNCVVRVSRSGSGTCAILINASLDRSNFRILGGSLFQFDAAGHGVRVEGGVGEDFDVIISNMYMRGSGGGTAVRFVNSTGEEAATVTGNIFDNWSKGVDADGCDNIIVVGNAYPNTTTPTSGGGGTGTVLESVHTLLDGAFHSDTLLGVVVDGDVIIGNVTPKWSRLAISIPAANIRNVLGIDNGELRPSWKAALSAANPSTISEGASASSGTSLLFSQQDHVHGAPATWTPSVHTHTIAHNDLTGVTADQHHAGFVGLIINGPSTISPDANDLITIEDSATVTWASSGAGKIAATAVAGGVDHGGLAGLGDDDHSIYFLLAGRGAGQVAYGGLNASGNLTLGSTADAVKGVIGLVDNSYAAGYLRVGSAVAPTNVTAGDLTAVRALVGTDAAIEATAVLDVEGGTLLYGRAKVTDDSASKAVGTDTGLSVFHIPAIVAGSWYEEQVMVEARPTGASSAVYVGQRLYSQTQAGNANNYSANPALVASQAIVQHLGGGTLAYMYGKYIQVIMGAAAGAITGAAYGLVQSFVSSSAAAIAEVRGIYILTPTLGAGVLTNYYGIYIANSTVAATLNIGIRVEGMNQAALWLSSDTASRNVIAWGSARDVNLYRSAANVLKTDDSLIVAAHMAVGSDGTILARYILDVEETIILTTGQTAVGIGGMVTARAADTVSGAYLYGLYYMTQTAGAVAGTWGNFAGVAAIYAVTALSKNTHDVARGLKLEHTSSAAEAPTVTLYEGIGFVNALDGGAFTTFKGINIPDMCAGAGSVGTFYGLDIAGQTVAAASIGIRLGAFATSALWFNTDTPASGVIHWGTAKDTNLYRSAANVLKTDDAFHVAGGLATNNIAELTGAAGVTVDDCLIRDGCAALAQGLREASGPTDLAMGAVADGEYLKRVGTTIVSGVPAGGGAMATDPLWDAAGDLAVGTGADTGAKLSLTVPGGAALLNVLGVVNGETTPTWKALFDATVPTTIAESAAAAAGTATVAAHRDHTHGAPATWAATAHGSAQHTGKIGERQIRILIPLKQPLAVATGRAVVDYEHKLLGSVATRIRSWYVRAASNITGDTVFKLYLNGAAIGGAQVTVSSGTRESAVDDFTAETALADGDYLDVEEVSGSTENIAVDVYVLGDEDVMTAV